MEMIEEIVKWHKETFPDADLESQKLKFLEEYREYLKSWDLMELADMAIVNCVLRYRFLFFRFDDIFRFEAEGTETILREIIIKKMKINKKRKWKKENGVYRHE